MDVISLKNSRAENLSEKEIFNILLVYVELKNDFRLAERSVIPHE
jgi:hypothetical protein